VNTFRVLSRIFARFWLVTLILAAPTFAAQPPQQTGETGKQSNDGAITIGNTYKGASNSTQNPIGAVAKTSQITVTQPPTIIIQATGGPMQLLPSNTVCDASVDNQVRISSTRAMQYCDPVSHAWTDIATGTTGGVLTYNSPGNYSWTVPSGITSITAYAGGAGGSWGAVLAGSWVLCPSTASGTAGSSSVSGTGGTVVGYGGGHGGTQWAAGGSGGSGSGQVVANGASHIYPSSTVASGGSLDGYSAGSGVGTGGGGGGIAKSTFSVVAGQTYSISVGAASTESSGSTNCAQYGVAGNGIAVIKY